MNSRRSRTTRSHVSQIGNLAGDDVPGIRRTVTETCTGHSHTEARDSTPIRVPPRRRTRILILLAALVATVLLPVASAAAGPLRSAAAVLASDDLGHAISPTDWRVARYERALAPLANVKCRETPHRIALYSWNARRELQRNRISYSHLQILRYVNSAIPRSIAPTRCLDIFTMWLLLVEKG